MTVVPPIKSQGIKTKLTEWIKTYCSKQSYNRWVEPFMGTGAVAFNMRPRNALLCDSDPHIIRFYKSLQNGSITANKTRIFLKTEGAKLFETEGEHYYVVRDRFNKSGNPLDFLFLSRSCFNGLMRFNKNGKFNVPFCRKPHRFAQALITKIVNQVEAVSYIVRSSNYEFKHQEFAQTLNEVESNDMVYCDPPYIGRHVDYYDSWTHTDERLLQNLLAQSKALFIMSTWLMNKYRINDYVYLLWKDCSIVIKEHFYYVAAKESNRNPIIEALLLNFEAEGSVPITSLNTQNRELMSKAFIHTHSAKAKNSDPVELQIPLGF